MNDPKQLDQQPGCTSWCTHHQRRENEWGEIIESCVNWLYVHRAGADAGKGTTTASMYLSTTHVQSETINGQVDEGSMGFSVFGSIPWGVQPEDARELAAALIRGAEIVEAARTVTCPTCDRAVHPVELSEDPERCYRCENEQRIALWRTMRGLGPVTS